MAPSPPVGMTVNAAAEHGALAVMSALVAATLLFALFQWFRSRRSIVLLLFIAGGGMMLMEPMVDTVAGCWFPSDSVIAYVGWGRPIPLWVCLTYFVYFGAGAGVIWLSMRRGLSVAQIWMFYLGEIIADVILETVLLDRGVYTYYGGQPLLIGHFPFWWAPVNALVSLSAAAFTLRFTQAISGPRTLLLVPALLSTSAAVNAAAGWPSWFVINSGVGPVWTQIGGIASVAIAFTIAQLIARSVAAPRAAAAATVAPAGGLQAA